jgi:hypothetical protein
MSYPFRKWEDFDDAALEKELRRLTNLDNALQDRLEAVARGSGRSALDIKISKTQIFLDLNHEQLKLIPPSLSHQKRTEKEIRNWAAGKGSHGPPFCPDFAARLVRIESLRRGVRSRRFSEENAIWASKGVGYADLTSKEKRAADFVLGRRRRWRHDPADPDMQIAKAVSSDWLTPVPPFRAKNARSLSIEAIVHTALPHIDELANANIRGGTPDNEHDPAVMEPPGLGALVAIVRMAYPNAGFEYICDLIQSYRQAPTSASN